MASLLQTTPFPIITLLELDHIFQKVEIKTGTRGQINARKNVTIIGKRPMVEKVELNLVYRHRAVTVSISFWSLGFVRYY